MKSGQRLRSQVCGGEVIVIRADGIAQPLETGGQPLVDPKEHGGGTTEQADPGFLLGKRYELADADDVRLEVMVTKPGAAPLTYAGRQLISSPTKTLPTSD